MKRALGAVPVWALAVVMPAQVAVLQIRVVEGEGGVHAPGSRLARPIVVEITDDLGQPVSGATVNFHLPEDGPGGVFGNSLRTYVTTTDGAGRAALRGVTFNRTPGRFTIRVIAVKEQTRAGTFSYQYIAGPKGGAAASRAVKPRRGRWLTVGVVAAATAAGIVVGAARGQSGAQGQVAAAVVAAPPAAPPSIGAPTITVGRP